MRTFEPVHVYPNTGLHNTHGLICKCAPEIRVECQACDGSGHGMGFLHGNVCGHCRGTGWLTVPQGGFMEDVPTLIVHNVTLDDLAKRPSLYEPKGDPES